MALSVTVVSPSTGNIGLPAQLAQKGGGGWLRVRVATLSGDNLYPGGGYPVTASTFELFTQILGYQEIGTSGSVSLTSRYDYTNQTIRLYASASELLTSSTSGWAPRVLVWGL